MRQIDHDQIGQRCTLTNFISDLARLNRQRSNHAGRRAAFFKLLLNRPRGIRLLQRLRSHDMQTIQPRLFTLSDPQRLLQRIPTLIFAAQWHQHIGKEMIGITRLQFFFAPLADFGPLLIGNVLRRRFGSHAPTQFLLNRLAVFQHPQIHIGFGAIRKITQDTLITNHFDQWQIPIVIPT